MTEEKGEEWQETSLFSQIGNVKGETIYLRLTYITNFTQKIIKALHKRSLESTCSMVPDAKGSWEIFVRSTQADLCSVLRSSCARFTTLPFSTMSVTCVNSAAFLVQKHRVLNLTFVNVSYEGISKRAFTIYFSKREKKKPKKVSESKQKLQESFQTIKSRIFQPGSCSSLDPPWTVKATCQ